MITGSYGKIMFSFVKNTVQFLPKWLHTIWYSNQQWIRVSVAPQPHQHLVFSVFQILDNIIGVVVTHCCFNLHLFDDLWCGECFYVLICHLYTALCDIIMFQSTRDHMYSSGSMRLQWSWKPIPSSDVAVIAYHNTPLGFVAVLV